MKGAAVFCYRVLLLPYLFHERVHKRFPFHPFSLTSFHMSVFSNRQFNIQRRNGKMSPSPNISNTCLVNINSFSMMPFCADAQKVMNTKSFFRIFFVQSYVRRIARSVHFHREKYIPMPHFLPLSLPTIPWQSR